MNILAALGGLFREGNAPAVFLSQLQLFAIKFIEHAPQRFGVQLLGGVACGRARCKQQSVAVCEGCGAPICLEHGWFSHAADALCSKCARLAVRNISNGKAWGIGRRQDEEDEQASRAGRIEPHVVAFMQLGLPVTATLDDVKRRYRALTATLHPDRHTGLSDANRKEIEETFKRLTTSYNVLERYLARKAA